MKNTAEAYNIIYNTKQKVEEELDRVMAMLNDIVAKEVLQYLEDHKDLEWFVIEQIATDWLHVKTWEDEETLASIAHIPEELWIKPHVEIWVDNGWVHIFGQKDKVRELVNVKE